MPTPDEIEIAVEELRDWHITRFSMHRRQEIADLIWRLWTNAD